jgi:hypothetical protein
MRGVMGDQQRRQVAASAQILVANLADDGQEEASEEDAPITTAEGSTSKEQDGVEEEEVELPDGKGMSVLCAGGRDELDDAAAAMLAQVLEVQGATVSKASLVDLEPAGIRRLERETIDTVVVGFLNRDSLKHARFLVRRLKRAKAGLRIGIVFWSDAEQGDAGQERQALAADISADFVAHGMVNAVLGAPAPAVPLKVVSKRRDRRRPAPRKRVPAQATAATA